MVASHPPALSLATAALLLLVLAPATVIDLRERRIPNRLTGSGALAALGLGLLLDPAGQPTRIVAAGLAVGFLLAVRAPRPTGLGLGDVKLVGVLGLCLGPVVVVALAAAFVAGSAVAVAVGVRRGWRALRATSVPFAPFLAVGAAVAFAAGRPLLAGYVALIG